MDPKELFERRAGRGIGPMEPAPRAPGPLESVQDAVFDRLPLPISDPLPRMVEFRPKSGSWFSFPYHCLMGIEYAPHSRLTLTFTAQKVVIIGRNLEALYRALLDQSCPHIAETDRAAALAAAEDAPEIQRIELRPLREPRAQAPEPEP